MQHDMSPSHADKNHGSLKSYTIGFVFSILLTIIPITVVMSGWLAGKASAIILMVTAVLQLVVQLIFFMHLREEKKPRYNLLTLILGLIILLVIVIGSMWIMMYNMVAL
ncbi:cytochrome o ubiquinol oxidase subunit IV [Paenibacillus terrigena]|uniref:cytochrome o ubiquinol oxidase subunit IV n=1 Tax=Paenibacillus terrigena TaxID=369333 RepID=UPI000366786D|nr:cytochrome o ubiquinol oxidase subunit IV [Paenibacillus terrigena]